MRKQKTIEQLEREAEWERENKKKCMENLFDHLENHSSNVVTAQDKFEDMIYQVVGFDDLANKIMEYVKSVIEKRDYYKILWGDPVDGYPEEFYSSFYLIIKPIVVEWAEENMPQAFWIPMFT